MILGMFEYLSGKFISLDGTRLCLDVNGAGYCVHVPVGLNLPSQNEGLKLFISPIYSDANGLTLYGFMRRVERSFFEALISVSGVGPKTALALMSKMSLEQLATAITSQDSKLISKAPGIGQKTAERLIIDLKSKVAKLPIEIEGPLQHFQDAVSALEGLGYSSTHAQKAVKGALEEDASASLGQLITRALQRA